VKIPVRGVSVIAENLGPCFAWIIVLTLWFSSYTISTVDVKETSSEIMELFIRLVNSYNSMEKIPAKHGAEHGLYHSERHLLDKIGDNPDMNISELAHLVGVTKGAISQVVRKLEIKGVVRRHKKGSNDKEVFVELTKAGKVIHEKHKAINQETVNAICKQLERYSDGNVESLVSMFRWFNTFLDLSREKMKRHTQTKS